MSAYIDQLYAEQNERHERTARGHAWKRDEDGDIDVFAFNPHDPHNGPACGICGYGYCHHCADAPDCDCPGLGA